MTPMFPFILDPIGNPVTQQLNAFFNQTNSQNKGASKMSIFIIAEIGINHNGDVEIAKQLIDVARDAGADAVKFQKRTIDLVYTKEMLDSPRESPWGNTQRRKRKGLNSAWMNIKRSMPTARKKELSGLLQHGI